MTTIRNVAAANATTRVFLVSGNPATLSKMTVSGGRVDRFDSNSGCASDICGAGIQNNGNLTLNETYFTDNRVSGTIINGLRVGGAVSSSQNSVLTILNSTFSDNSVSGLGTNLGGAIYSAGTLVVANSTIANNSLTLTGSGNLFGGGIAREGGTATFFNTTIANNALNGSAAGDACAGGGVFQSANFFGDVKALNVIIANNGGNNCQSFGTDYSGTLNSLGNNLIGNTAGATIIGTTTGNILNQNPPLAPLVNYGGTMPTLALLPGSSAINAGNNCVTTLTCAGNNPPTALTADQRGKARTGQVDIGAFEVNNSANGGNYRATLPFGRQGSNYNFVIAPNNGTAAYQVTGGNLPNGVTLNTNLAPNAVVSLGGIPTQSGTFDFSVTTDAGGNSVVTDYRLVVIPMTSANASVSGRVFTNEGNALRNAIVLLTDGNGNTRKVQTGSFGVYRIDELAVGQTYVIQVVSKKFTFAPQTIFLTDNLTDLNFTAQ